MVLSEAPTYILRSNPVSAHVTNDVPGQRSTCPMLSTAHKDKDTSSQQCNNLHADANNRS